MHGSLSIISCICSRRSEESVTKLPIDHLIMTPYAFKNKDFLNVELRETWCLGVFVVFELLNHKSLQGTKAHEEK